MQDLSFNGRVALITGVSKDGLGFQYAKMLIEAGCTVVINDYGVDWQGNRTSAATDAVVEELRSMGGTVYGITGDIVTEADRIVREAAAAFGRLDIVINNAGSGGSFDQLINVHLLGSNRITEAAWPHLVASGSGRVVNVSSGGAFGAPAMPGYAAAKGAMISLTRTQAILGADDGIRANCIMPAAWTQSTQGINFPGFPDFMEKHFQPNNVAAFVAYLSHQDTQVSGELFSVGGGLVTRIVYAETSGAVATTTRPAEWAGLIGQAMDTSELSTLTSMWSQLAGFTEKHSRELGAEFDALGINLNVKSKLGV